MVQLRLSSTQGPAPSTRCQVVGFAPSCNTGFHVGIVAVSLLEIVTSLYWSFTILLMPDRASHGGARFKIGAGG